MQGTQHHFLLLPKPTFQIVIWYSVTFSSSQPPYSQSPIFVFRFIFLSSILSRVILTNYLAQLSVVPTNGYVLLVVAPKMLISCIIQKITINCQDNNILLSKGGNSLQNEGERKRKREKKGATTGGEPPMMAVLLIIQLFKGC